MIQEQIVLKTQYFEDCGKDQYVNLAYGGGTLKEIINTFWEVVKYPKVSEVVIGVNFNLYNKANTMDRVKEAVDLKNNFLSYSFSKYVFKSNGYILKSLITNEKYKVGVPEMTEDEFWKNQLKSAANNSYRIYQYPTNYYDELKRMKKYCDENKVDLWFFIPPTHVDLQNKIDEFNLSDEEKQFKDDLKSLGKVLDFDYPNDLTKNKDNFIDPFHCNDSIAKRVARVLICEENHQQVPFTRTNHDR